MSPRSSSPVDDSNSSNTSSTNPTEASSEVAIYGDATVMRPYNEADYGKEIVITVGSHTASKSWKPIKQPLGAFIAKLCQHKVGEKDGPAFVLGDMAPGQRLKVAVKTLECIGLDDDTGTPSAEWDASLSRFGFTAIRYSTHSHLKSRTEFKKDKLKKFAKDANLDGYDIDDELIRRFLREDQRWHSSIVETAIYAGEDHTEKGIVVYVEHCPMPKHRIVVPLAEPFEIAKEGDTQKEAMDKWAKVPEALANMLGLPFDRSCIDPSRLFYFPRHAKNKPFEISLWGGPLFDYRSLPLSNPLDDIAAEANKGGGKSVTPEGRELGRWSITHAPGFQIVDVLEANASDRIRGSASSNGKTIECPFDEDHSNPGDTDDTGCFAVNAGYSGHSELFTISCRHESCRNKTMLDMLGKMLKDGWFDKSVLTDDNFNAIIEETPEKPKSEVVKKIEKEDTARKGYMGDIAKLAEKFTQKEFDATVELILDAKLGDAALAKAIKALAKACGITEAKARKLVSKRADKRKKAKESEERLYPELELPLGIQFDDETGRPVPNLTNCLVLLEKMHHPDWHFAYNELTQTAVLRGETVSWAAKLGREINDAVIRVIRHFLIEQWGIEFKKSDVEEACFTLAGYSRFNPVVEYLDGLEWDKTPRVEKWLSTYLGAEDNDYTRGVGKAWLIGAVRRARHPGTKFDTVPIFEGSQGVGKSTALKILGGEWFSDAPLGDVTGKDASIQLHGIWIMEMAELSDMNRSDSEAMKAFVSRFEDSFRAPYDRVKRTVPRRNVFVGTSNGAHFVDQTGNRRYWPISVGKIDLEALARDRDQLWAEAAALEASGESHVLLQELWSLAAKQQEDRVVTDPWSEDVQAYLDGLSESTTRVTSGELLTKALGVEPGNQTQAMGKRIKVIVSNIGGWLYKSFRDGGTVRNGYVRMESGA